MKRTTFQSSRKSGGANDIPSPPTFGANKLVSNYQVVLCERGCTDAKHGDIGVLQNGAQIPEVFIRCKVQLRRREFRLYFRSRTARLYNIVTMRVTFFFYSIAKLSFQGIPRVQFSRYQVATSGRGKCSKHNIICVISQGFKVLMRLT